jgi:hypothetical protein
MKAAWLVALGPNSDKALVRLEVLADTYLSMNAPVQHALPAWLAGRSAIQDQIRSRTQDNLAELDRALVAQNSPGSDSERDGQILVNRLEIEGGWYAILRIPATQLDELTVRELLELGVLIHPGYFFGMRATGWLVVSLLAKTEEFQTGMARLLEYVRRNWKSNL